jgi:hypothetical protein
MRAPGKRQGVKRHLQGSGDARPEHILRWISSDDGRRRKYETARKACVEYWADEIIQIATDGSRDTITDEKGRSRCDHEWVARSRLRIDTIKFLMMKIAPRVYGDKLPETIEARAMDVEEQRQALLVDDRPRRIERILVKPGTMIQDANGDWVQNVAADHLHQRIAELESELAGKNPAPLAPKLLEHDPGPLPSRMDKDIASRMVRLIRDHLRPDDQRDPANVLEEVLSVCRAALLAHYGPTGQLLAPV